MKIINKKIALGIMSAVLLGSIGITTLTTAAYANEEENSHPLVQALVEKFGLNEDEVESALDEIRADHFAMREQNREDKLNQAVEDGVLTQEQAGALQAKHQEMWQEREQEREEHREEMDAWFADQGIDHESMMQYMGGPGPKGVGGFGGGMHRMGK